MAGSLNKVQLIGHLGRDPESRSFANGDAVCNFSMATSESWKDKQTGERKERTEWHNITAHRGLAEVIGQYLRKGSKVYIEGALRTRKWQDKDGADKYTTEIIADQMIMLDGKPSGDSDGRQEQRAPADSGAPRRGGAPAQPQQRAPAATGFADMDDDIPF